MHYKEAPFHLDDTVIVCHRACENPVGRVVGLTWEPMYGHEIEVLEHGTSVIRKWPIDCVQHLDMD